MHTLTCNKTEGIKYTVSSKMVKLENGITLAKYVDTGRPKKSTWAPEYHSL